MLVKAQGCDPCIREFDSRPSHQFSRMAEWLMRRFYIPFYVGSIPTPTTKLIRT